MTDAALQSELSAAPAAETAYEPVAPAINVAAAVVAATSSAPIAEAGSATPGESSSIDTASHTPPTASPADTSATGMTPATADASASSSTASALPDGTEGNVAAPLAGAPSSSEPLAPVQPVEPAVTAGEAPNVGATLAAVASGAAQASSAPTASPAAGASSSAASSAAEQPLHVQVAHHLEAIFQLAKDHAEVPQKTLSEQTSTIKTHVGDVLHKLRNGMQVAEGELMQKLEALFHML